MSLSDATTLTELVREGRNNRYRKKDYCELLKLGDNLLPLARNYIELYWDFIEANKIRLKFDPDTDEYMTYKYRPKELSLVLYGTEELYTVLLKLNNMSHEIEFTKKRIYIADRRSINTILNKIIGINEEAIISNQKNYL